VCPAFLLTLDNQWSTCTVRHRPNGMLTIHDAARGIAGGTSGSPIIAKDGSAIGIVCLATGGDLPTEGGPNPRLVGNLPCWFLQEVRADHATARA
jgi:hypothetical protein